MDVPRAIQVAVVVIIPLLVVGCARDPLDAACPALTAGDLVITEIRGNQSASDDELGEWIEVYNASGETADLRGLTLSINRLDTTGREDILVRADSLSVPAEGFVVLGRYQPSATPAHVDYGYASDLDKRLYDGGLMQLLSCGELLDKVGYFDLPGTGTWSLNGSTTPDADANDVPSAWCIDDNEDNIDPQRPGVPGTPQAANRTCPPTQQ